jgi:hypothetical protein
MKKRLVILSLILVGLISIFVYSLARAKQSFPRPEDTAGREASAFMPQTVKDKPVAKGSAELKLTGPVWVDK